MFSNTTTLLVLAMAIAPTWAAAEQPAGTAAVLTTTHFALFSDLATNVNDALIAAANARRAKRPDAMTDGEGSACFDRLSADDRQGWARAVDYYAVGKSTSAQRILLRLELAGLVQRDALSDPANRRLLGEFAEMRAAAAPAYRRCQWSGDDARNRRWIEAVAPLLAAHEAALGEQLPQLFRMRWSGLPFRVDLVPGGPPLGADSATPDFPTVHVLVSSSNSRNQGLAALEIVFHEATHALAGPESTLARALATAFRDAGISAPADFVHQVHFFMTGEAVRRELARTGSDAYTPYLYATRIFSDSFRDSASRTWPAYIDGTRTLDEAAADLVRALNRRQPR